MHDAPPCNERNVIPKGSIGQTTDDDLKAMFAYFKSLPPIHNPIPSAIPPEAPPAK